MYIDFETTVIPLKQELSKPVEPLPADPQHAVNHLAETVTNAAKEGKLDVPAIVQGAFTGANGQLLFDHISDMGDRVNTLERNYAEVHALLLKLDAHNYVRNDAKEPEKRTVVKYADRWNELHERFRLILSDSKDIASEGKVFADKYGTLIPERLADLAEILKDPVYRTEEVEDTKARAKKPLQLLRTSLEVLQQDMTATQAKASEISQRLQKLTEGVNQCAKDLNSDIKLLAPAAAEATKKAEENVRECEKALAKIQGTVSDSTTALLASAGTTGGALLVGCIGGAVLTTTLFPIAMFALAGLSFASLLGSAFATATFSAELAEKILSLKQARKELERCKQDSDALQETRVDVSTINTRTGEIIMHLRFMFEIWNTIQSDATQLLTWLKSCLDSRSSVEDVIEFAGMNHIGTVYGVLGQALQIYATKVGSAVPHKDTSL